jgi:hypothetical protein
MPVTENNIYRVRREFRAKPSKTTAKKPAGSPTPASKTDAAKPSEAKPTAAPASKPASSSDFIRSQPVTLPAAEVVAKGKEKGLKFTDSLVYMVRGRKTPKKRHAKAAARKATPEAKPRAPSTITTAPGRPKSVLLQGQRGSAPTKVQARRGRARGAVTATLTTKAAPPPVRTAAARSGAPAARRTATTSSLEDLLRAAAWEIGLNRAIAILAEQRAPLRPLIGG